MPVLAYYWIGVCAYLNCAGWLLTAIHQVNAAGYAVALVPVVFATVALLRRGWRPAAGYRMRRRLRRPLPGLFLLLSGLALLGGLLYAPSNYDALTYRLPRMLNWLATGAWHWIPTTEHRMNYSGVAWEWTAMPFFALTHSDRGMFLINTVGYMLMPGLVFSLLRQAGVARRVAWTWMWVLPLGYGYVTQAGSVGNDLTGVLYILLAIDFALRARRSGRAGELWMSMLAAALMTGTKFCDLPMLLPWAVAVWPALPLAWKKPLGSLAAGAVAILISSAPIMLANQVHTGNWTGDPKNSYKMQITNPAAGLVGNGYLLAEGLLQPPLLPGSHEIDRAILNDLPDWVVKGFPRVGWNRFNEIPGEEGAGLGLAITLPVLIGAIWALWRGRAPGAFLRRLPLWTLAGVAAAVFYMAKMGSEATARLMMPYYILCLIPLLMTSVQAELLARRWWRDLLFVLTLSTVVVVVLSIARPLWPAQIVCNWAAGNHPKNTTLQRLAFTYDTFAHRNDCLAALRSALPQEVREIGFIAGPNDTDYSLWRPLGQRVVTYPRKDDRRFVQQPDVEWLVVKEKVWPEMSRQSLADWAGEHHGKIVKTVALAEIAALGDEYWSLVHLEATDPK